MTQEEQDREFYLELRRALKAAIKAIEKRYCVGEHKVESQHK